MVGPPASRTLALHPSATAAHLALTLQRALDLVSFGLHAARSAPAPGPSLSGGIELPDIAVQLLVVPHARMGLDEIRSEFRRWILEAGFREVVEAIGPALESVRQIGVICSFGGKLTGADWNERVVLPYGRFERLTLVDKLDRLVELCGADILPELTDAVLSINVARNCLVHRCGVVGDRDTNTSDGSTLQVRWSRIDPVLRDVAGEELVVTHLPFEAAEGSALSMRWRSGATEFKRGERIDLSVREFADVCWTMWRFGQQLSANAARLMKTSGIPPVGSPLPREEIPARMDGIVHPTEDSA